MLTVILDRVRTLITVYRGVFILLQLWSFLAPDISNIKYSVHYTTMYLIAHFNHRFLIYGLGDERLENRPIERNLGVSVNGKLNMSHQCTLAVKRARHIPGCIKHDIA